jgi:hypothetical protein
MRRPLGIIIMTLALAVAAAGCDNTDESSPTAPGNPTAVTTTLTGTLTTNGAESKPFTVNSAGLVTVTLKTVTPDSTAVVGLGLGTWNGVNCSVSLSNDAAVQGVNLIGQSSSRGNLCVRVFDPAGSLAAPIEYTIDVTHF